jgi:hypothetical protein
MLRTQGSALRPLWSASYRAVARSVAALLRLGIADCAAYVAGSFESADTVYGVSDIDLVIVCPRPEQAMVVRQRWQRLCRRVPSLSLLVYVAVYSELELGRVAAASPCVLASAERALPSVAADLSPSADPMDVAVRPGLNGAMAGWRRFAGPEHRPATPAVGRDRLRVGAWLELQHWWRYAFEACMDPGGPRKPYLCVKLCAEPARVWLRLATGEHVTDRGQALRRARALLPEDAEALESALRLRYSLERSPRAPVAEALGCLVRLTSRIATLLAREVVADGTTEVQLSYDAGTLLALPRTTGDPLRAVAGAGIRLLPLVDWRALVYPGRPDEAFAPLPGSPSDPAVVAAAALAGRTGAYGALRADGLLVLPAAGAPARTRLRSVHCPLTAPVSLAVLDGATTAHFPNVPGWSVSDLARCAVAEHHRWLQQAGDRIDACSGPDLRANLGALIGAARAALLWEGVTSGRPELPLPVADVATSLSRHPGWEDGLAMEVGDAYTDWRSGERASRLPMRELRSRTMRLPAYGQAPTSPAPEGRPRVTT